ncbi:uncharacterized protein PV09_01086 [Verruconis gallopava]|uniref:Uncharacterized protein n=1 Tax=Verruconis gallopava TaxID=253628 RepID=A0A0D2AN50_9PEZI|nr:uncharacterized protein PV09_01086 [Verruconis gallopava]KIW08153.1 hypothetical protein PV09_01086 [Verruconis gallopava]
MVSVFSALGDFVKSIYELVVSMLQTFFGLVETFVRLIVNFFTSVIQLLVDTTRGVLSGIFDIIGGLGNFLLANAAIIGLAAVGFYGYLVYQRRQGQAVTVQGKRLN